MMVNPALKTGKYIKTQVTTDEEVTEIQPLNWDEKDLFEKAVKKHYPKYYVFFLTALRTGMRMGELIALKPGDIDFNSRFIMVSRNAVRGIIGTPKNVKSRKVKISPQLHDELSKYLLLVPQQEM